MKNIIKSLAVGLCIVTVITALGSPKFGEQMNDLLLENVEALALYEGGGITGCLGIGCVDCPIAEIKVEYVMIEYSLESFN